MSIEHQLPGQRADQETANETIGHGLYMTVSPSHEPGYVIKEPTFVAQFLSSADQTPALAAEYAAALQNPDNGVLEHVAATAILGTTLESFQLQQERIDGQPLQGHMEDGQQVAEVSETERQELTDIVHGLLKIYLQTYGLHAPMVIPTGAAGEFEKIDSYIRGQSLVRPELGRRLYFVDTFPSHFKDAGGAIDSLNKFCTDFQVDQNVFNQEFAALQRLVQPAQ
jgi:hypothetical protein